MDPIKFAAMNVVNVLLEETMNDNIPESIRKEWVRWRQKRNDEFFDFVERVIRDTPHCKVAHEVEMIALTGYLPDGDEVNTPTLLWAENAAERLRANSAGAETTR